MNLIAFILISIFVIFVMVVLYNEWLCLKGLSQITPGARTVSKIT